MADFYNLGSSNGITVTVTYINPTDSYIIDGNDYRHSYTEYKCIVRIKGTAPSNIEEVYNDIINGWSSITLYPYGYLDGRAYSLRYALPGGYEIWKYGTPTEGTTVYTVYDIFYIEDKSTVVCTSSGNRTWIEMSYTTPSGGGDTPTPSGGGTTPKPKTGDVGTITYSGGTYDYIYTFTIPEWYVSAGTRPLNVNVKQVSNDIYESTSATTQLTVWPPATKTLIYATYPNAMRVNTDGTICVYSIQDNEIQVSIDGSTSAATPTIITY